MTYERLAGAGRSAAFGSGEGESVENWRCRKPLRAHLGMDRTASRWRPGVAFAHPEEHVLNGLFRFIPVQVMLPIFHGVRIRIVCVPLRLTTRSTFGLRDRKRRL